MNYRHIYHAGNFADIIKHLALVAVLEKLKMKDKAFAVLDAFAGVGLYDLSSIQASKTLESETGVKLLNNISNPPYLLARYCQLIKLYLSRNSYPGSPLITSHLLRDQDRLIACELHKQDILELKNLFKNDRQTCVHHIDAYSAIKAFLPFKEGRGLVLLDPAFEVKNEFTKLLEGLKLLRQRATNIPIIIWYPIKEEKEVKSFYKNYLSLGFKEAIIIEFQIKTITKGMNKCGVMIINPPEIEEQIREVLDCLTKQLYENKACWKIDKLVA